MNFWNGRGFFTLSLLEIVGEPNRKLWRNQMRKLSVPSPDTSGTLKHQKKYPETMNSNTLIISSYFKNQTNFYILNYFSRKEKKPTKFTQIFGLKCYGFFEKWKTSLSSDVTLIAGVSFNVNFSQVKFQFSYFNWQI